MMWTAGASARSFHASRAAHSWYSAGGACVGRAEAPGGPRQGSNYTRGGRPVYAGEFQADDGFLKHHGHRFWRLYGKPRYRWMRWHGRTMWVWLNSWPLEAQIETAYRGWLSQGWGAWPNTARLCRLL